MSVRAVGMTGLSRKFWGSPDYSDDIFFSRVIIHKIFEGQMWIRNLPTIITQIFSESIHNSKDISKSRVDPDDICLGDRQACMGSHLGFFRFKFPPLRSNIHILSALLPTSHRRTHIAIYTGPLHHYNFCTFL